MNIIIKKSDKPDKKYTAVIDNKKINSFRSCWNVRLHKT
jgi:hypothetical protein